MCVCVCTSVSGEIWNFNFRGLDGSEILLLRRRARAFAVGCAKAVVTMYDQGTACPQLCC